MEAGDLLEPRQTGHAVEPRGEAPEDPGATHPSVKVHADVGK